MPKYKKVIKIEPTVLTRNINYPLWFSVTETAKLCGLNAKTIRRAIQGKKIKYKIINDRYLVDLTSIILYCFKFKKLKNKVNSHGIGQYIEKWRE